MLDQLEKSIAGDNEATILPGGKRLRIIDGNVEVSDSRTCMVCSPSTAPSILVAIPAYNEERFIASVVFLCRNYTSNVVVIDDGSRDRTATLAETAGAKVLRHGQNSGKTAAINTGLAYARDTGVDCLVFIDGDGQHLADEIDRVAEPVLRGEADMVIGSRFLTVKSPIPAYRKVGQFGFTTLTNLASALPVTDSQSGFRAFSRRAIDILHFNGTGLSVESEMQFAAREHSLVVAEVPISVVYAEMAKRNPFAHGMQILENIFKLVSLHRPLFFFSLQGLAMMAAGIFLSLSIITRDGLEPRRLELKGRSAPVDAWLMRVEATVI